MKRMIFLICSLCSLHTFADTSSLASVATWKAVAVKDSTRSRNSIDIGTLGAANLVPEGRSENYLSSGEQKIFVLPRKQDIPEYKLFTQVISNVLSNEDKTSELEVNVLYGNKLISTNGYQQILTSEKQENLSFNIASADSGMGDLKGNVDVGFVFFWDDSKSI